MCIRDSTHTVHRGLHSTHCRYIYSKSNLLTLSFLSVHVSVRRYCAYPIWSSSLPGSSFSSSQTVKIRLPLFYLPSPLLFEYSDTTILLYRMALFAIILHIFTTLLSRYMNCLICSIFKFFNAIFCQFYLNLLL